MSPIPSACAVGALLGALLVANVRAQTLPLQHWQHSRWAGRDGLPAGGLYQLERTPDGFLWGSAIDGVVRFDGLRFTPVDSAMTSFLKPLGSERPMLLGIDDRGTLLFTTTAGIAIEYHLGAFRAPDPSTRIALVSATDGDGQERIWIVAGRERRAHQLRAGRLLPAGFPAAVPDTGILNIVADTGGGIWIGTRSEGLWHLRADNSAQQYHEPLHERGVRPLLQDRSGRLWILSSGVWILSDGRWREIRLPARPDGVIRAMVAREAPDRTIWLGTRGQGVVRYRDGEVQQFSETEGLSDATVHDLLIDPAGSVWIATEAGLDRLRPAPFVTLPPRTGLPFRSPTSILPDANGSIWAGEYGTEEIFSLDGGLITRAGTPLRTTVYPMFPNSRIGSGLNGGVWVAKRDAEQLFLFRNGRLVPPAGIALPEGVRAFRSVDARAGHTWVMLAPTGLGVIEHGRFRHVPIRPGQPEPNILRMVRDSLDRLWLLAEEPAALYRITGTDTVEEIPVGLTAEDQVFALAFRTPDTLWLAARSTLIRITREGTARVPHPDASHPIRGRSPVMLLQGAYLWLANEGGIMRVNLADLNRAADGGTEAVPARRFDEQDGLLSPKLTTINPDPAFLGHDGRLWFSTPAGLAVADPAQIVRDTVPPIPHVDELTVDGARIPLEGAVTVGPDPGRLEFRYTATGAVDPHRIRLEYLLEGMDRGWTPSGPERFVAYGRLGPGTYSFRVRATNGDGVASRSEATLAFRVEPTWYQTRTFQALSLFLVSVLAATVFMLIDRARLRAASDRMQARYDATLSERTRLARELHDTLLQGFTGITLQLQALKRSMSSSPREAEISLGGILLTADATLREARQMVWDMRAPELDQHDLADALEMTTRQAIADAGIWLDFTVLGSRRRLDIGTETAALRIGREAVANAVKHAAPTVLTVTLHFATGQLSLLVQDNGRGCDERAINAAVEGGHWGIRGMRERAARSGGRLEVTGEVNRGTSVHLTLPVPQP